MDIALIYDPGVEAYRFPFGHPLKPERFTLTVDLIEQWGMLAEGSGDAAASGSVARALIMDAPPATVDDLLLIHSREYVDYVRAVSAAPESADLTHGIGPGDTPAFGGMHDAAALVAGLSTSALTLVVEGRCRRTFSPAGGLHHAMRDRASGFCVYNDCAIAIEQAIRANPGLRVAYVDIDAHHGDGVQAAFYDRADVLTISVHESGRYLFPGTGFERDIGIGAGTGYAVNVPLPPYAGAAQYLRVADEIIAPSLRAFRPDVIFAQLGADTHRDDPLTQLDLTVEGFVELVGRIVDTADEVCDGRIAATGGGGYGTYFAVPRMWASAFAMLLGESVPTCLPDAWLTRASAAAGLTAPPVRHTFEEQNVNSLDASTVESAELLTDRAVKAVIEASPLLARP